MPTSRLNTTRQTPGHRVASVATDKRRLTGGCRLAGLLVALLVGLPVVAAAQPNLEQIHARWRNDDGGEAWLDANYGYRKKLTIDSALVSGSADLTNMPILVSFTDADLKHDGEASPGKVEHLSGFDIVFTDLATPNTKLDHEIERYTKETGEIVMWVRVPTLYHDVDTEIYIYYGNSTISATQEAVDGTWEANFKGVWHLEEATSATNVDSSGGNANNGTPTGGPTAEANGQISGAQDYTGTGDRSVISNHPDLDMGSYTNFTISAWVNPTSYVPGFPIWPWYSTVRTSRRALISGAPT